MGQRDNVLVEPEMEETKTGQSTSLRILVSLRPCERLLGRVSVGKRDGKHADILLSHEVGIQMGQANQSYETE